MTLTSLIITAAIIMVMVGWFVYKLVTDKDSIKDKDETVMDLLRYIQSMSESERSRIRTGIDNKVFDDDDSIT